MTGVSALAYVVVTGPVQRWRSFGTQVLGLQATGDTAGRVRFRSDERSWRLEVVEGPAGPGALVALGFETRNDDAFDALLASLTDAGVEVEEDRVLAEDRQVRRAAVLADPEGNRIELVSGAQSCREPFVSPRGVSFVCGDLGLGHVFLNSNDGSASSRWYLRHLGFTMSDTMTVGETDGYFMHCNARHHTLATAAVPGPPPGLGHLMLEVTSLGEVGRALDLVHSRGEPLMLTLGEHSNDRMISFYVVTPSGFAVEYGTDGLLVDDSTWNVAHYDAPSLWGHEFNPAALDTGRAPGSV